jgi:hypothetical protein
MREEILALLEELFREKFMTDEDWNEHLKVLASAGFTIERLHREVEIGLANGHSKEYQFALIRNIFNPSRN